MTEDEIYRCSTQYRHWSFTPGSLASLRESTNQLACDRVVAAITRSRAKEVSSDRTSQDLSFGNKFSGNEDISDSPVDCLTEDEELKLLMYYCEQCLKISDLFHFPSTVKATAVQYMKRFYLFNSLMTYHPKLMFRTCLFLATKTENSYISLSDFASEFPKTTAEDVIAPEFILTQGLRFNFEVRHPHRGLRGGLLELLTMARGDANLFTTTGKTARQLQTEMLTVPQSSADLSTRKRPVESVKDLENRCGIAHDRAKETLASAAILTDAYFLFTSAQIWMAAFMLADEPLMLFYLSTKFPLPLKKHSIEKDEMAADRLYDKLMLRLQACLSLLGSHHSTLDPSSRDELVRIEKKLYQCQIPERRDLVSLNRSQKRNGDEKDENAKAERIKKRRLEREKAVEDTDVFGGSLVQGGHQ